MKKLWILGFACAFFAGVFLAGCSGGGGDDDSTGTVTVTYGALTEAKTQTVGATGGTISISDASSPLNGLRIEVPENAASGDVAFTISYADVSSVSGLPSTASSASKLIVVETDGSATWDEFKIFDQNVLVTLPYTDGGTDDAPTMFYAYDDTTGALESMGAFYQDTTNKTITFLTGTFSKFLAIKLSLAVSELLGTNFTVDTSFRPASDGWYITNYGAYLARGGICYGMVSYAKWYYGAKGTGMYAKYQNSTSEWRDDDVAIELATRAHMAEDSRWQQTFNTVISSDATLNNQWKNPSSQLIGLSIIHALYVTGKPQVLGIYEQRVDQNGNNIRVGGHAILAYEYTNGTFEIYDPNHPNTTPGTAERQIGYTYGSGFVLPYNSGTDAASSSYKYNVVMHVSIRAAATNSAFSGLFDAAESSFTNSTIFPTVTITGCKAYDATTETAGADCTEETNATGQHMYVTSASTVMLYGTILGGYAQGGPATDAADVRQNRVVDKTLVFWSTDSSWVDVDNQLDAGTGTIRSEKASGVIRDGTPLTLSQGENDLIILATAENTFSNWAGYKRDIIKSNASRADMTITLTWNQNDTDVDLHVQEPTINSVAGTHIYYATKTSSGVGHPYLDVDNIWGYGPEHYFASEGMTLSNSTNLYGTYKIRVHYYADKDTDYETTQPVSGTIRWSYLMYADVARDIDYWMEGTKTFALTTANTSDTGNFDNTGASWSEITTIEYPEPDATLWGSDPPDVMLP